MTTETAESLTVLKKNKSKKSMASTWSLYIVQTRLGHWYTGISTDVARRLAAHQSGKGAKNLRGKGPLKLVYQQQVGSRSDATKLEIKVKRLSKVQKREFVATEHHPLKMQSDLPGE
ncbi:GIY-YIG nuclease family protein [Pseudoalteromonas shioyasakiensis]|uniref:GIY-YIG nuclease family protein n=1 Tax=Pseudoalteromonas shioyasakiensis TaxID=1190813 RepID=UPI002118B79E|nr:GIY-YIG nuclease family protein [Pseudoalteromonas shioyasakiensis]MCQ8877332.1 GIY-YIG nuclease family protein [Pseudoalteromonas shioyasakiensis]